MYWIKGGSIEKASMDGENREFLHEFRDGSASSFSLDYNNQIIFWTSDDMLKSSYISSVSRGRNITNVRELDEPIDALAYHQGFVLTTENHIRKIDVDSDSYTTDSFLLSDHLSICNFEGIKVVCQECQEYG